MDNNVVISRMEDEGGTQWSRPVKLTEARWLGTAFSLSILLAFTTEAYRPLSMATARLVSCPASKAALAGWCLCDCTSLDNCNISGS